MEIKNNNFELPPLTPIDPAAAPAAPKPDVQQNSLLQQAIAQEQQVDEDMKNKLKEIRYRVYIFFMLLVGLLSFPFFSKTLAAYDGLKTSIATSNQALSDKNLELQKSNQYIQLVDETKKIVGTNVNSGTKLTYSSGAMTYINGCLLSSELGAATCQKMPQNVKTETKIFDTNKNLLKSIALLRPISGSLANFDQKTVLKGLFQEILGDDVMSNAELTSFGEKTLIKYSDDTSVVEKLYKVPLTIQAKLTYTQLTTILANVEKKIIFTDPSLANLYDVKAVSYDLGKANTDSSSQAKDDTQDVTLNIDMYFYEQ